MDRGEESVNMLNFLENMYSQNRLIYIRGNHEDLFLDCLQELCTNHCVISSYHYSNGTVNTIKNFVEEHDSQLALRVSRGWLLTSEEVKQVEKCCKRFKKLISKSVPYYELGDYIFVHGWIPCKSDDSFLYHPTKNVKYLSNWRCLKPGSQKWKEARWLNGMLCW